MKKRIVLALLAGLIVLDAGKIAFARHAYTDPKKVDSVDLEKVIYAEAEDGLTLYFEDGTSCHYK